jgi:hypothetical protein
LVDDSRMPYNNVGSTSISNHTAPSSWIDRWVNYAIYCLLCTIQIIC